MCRSTAQGGRRCDAHTASRDRLLRRRAASLNTTAPTLPPVEYTPSPEPVKDPAAAFLDSGALEDELGAVTSPPALVPSLDGIKATAKAGAMLTALGEHVDRMAMSKPPFHALSRYRTASEDLERAEHSGDLDAIPALRLKLQRAAEDLRTARLAALAELGVFPGSPEDVDWLRPGKGTEASLAAEFNDALGNVAALFPAALLKGLNSKRAAEFTFTVTQDMGEKPPHPWRLETFDGGLRSWGATAAAVQPAALELLAGFITRTDPRARKVDIVAFNAAFTRSQQLGRATITTPSRVTLRGGVTRRTDPVTAKPAPSNFLARAWASIFGLTRSGNERTEHLGLGALLFFGRAR